MPDGDTVFEIGSISKVFTSLLLADMVVKGEVTLSDPISKYLPATVHVPTRNGKQITLLDLATHYSGLPPMPSNFSWDYSREQMFDFLSHYQLTRDPGAEIRLLEFWGRTVGTDFGTARRNGLRNAVAYAHHGSTANVSYGRASDAGDESRLHPWTRPWHAKSSWLGGARLAGAGGIRSTANDLLIFLAANLGIIKSPLQPAIKRMLTVRRPVSPGLQIALGWHIQNGDVAFHNGKTNGYHAFLLYDLHRKVGVVVLSNSFDGIEDIAWRTLSYPVTQPVEQPGAPGALPQ